MLNQRLLALDTFPLSSDLKLFMTCTLQDQEGFVWLGINIGFISGCNPMATTPLPISPIQQIQSFCSYMFYP